MTPRKSGCALTCAQARHSNTAMRMFRNNAYGVIVIVLVSLTRVI